MIGSECAHALHLCSTVITCNCPSTCSCKQRPPRHITVGPSDRQLVREAQREQQLNEFTDWCIHCVKLLEAHLENKCPFEATNFYPMTRREYEASLGISIGYVLSSASKAESEG
jgi:hypothetical protein